MKKFRLLSFLGIFLFLAGGTSFATNGMRMIGFGAVQRSMGGTGVGATLDTGSLVSNPAGITELGTRIDVGASYFNPMVTLDAPTGDIDSNREATPIPAIGLVIPTAVENLSFGVGVYGVAGMGVDYDLDALSFNLMYSSYSQMRFTPAAAYKINNMVSVGLTLNLMYATMEYSMYSTDYSSQVTNMTASAFGAGVTIGVKVMPVKMLAIGIAYESPGWFQDFKFNQFTNAVSRNRMEFEQPMNATIGFSFMPMETLTIAFDVQWIAWSQTNGNNKPKFTGGNMDMDWSDQIVYKLGIQFAPIQLLTIRVGCNYSENPLPSSTKDSAQMGANAMFPALAEWHFTAGLGFRLSEKIDLNIGGMYSPEKSMSVSTMGDVKMSQYSIDLGLACRF